MIEWKKIHSRNDMPFDRQFLVLWRGVIHIAEYDDEYNQFWIASQPSMNPGFAIVSKERENKFTHWADLNLPSDY